MTDSATKKYASFLAEIKRLLLEKDLREAWVDELIERDTPYLQRAFKEGIQPIAGAFEIYITEEDSAREPAPADHRLKLDVSPHAKKYLQQLVEIGLWGETTEEVASNLIQQQLVVKLEAGLIRQIKPRP